MQKKGHLCWRKSSCCRGTWGSCDSPLLSLHPPPSKAFAPLAPSSAPFEVTPQGLSTSHPSSGELHTHPVPSLGISSTHAWTSCFDAWSHKGSRSRFQILTLPLWFGALRELLKVPVSNFLTYQMGRRLLERLNGVIRVDT